MECTQRLECTQELYDTHTERTCPDQIGFLGICGTKHPVLAGPNKIGRDPQTCNIVLNFNSISRQHAVINILNSREYMLMDLGSANKTRLDNKALQSYIPHPLKDGDMVQFGDLFGVFRLLEENDDLPMTQAIDIPETPVPPRHGSKLNKPPVTLIPESPDVSDKEDSFITLSKPKLNHSSQTKSEKHKLSDSQFITTFGKKLPIHPVRSPRTDSHQTRRSSSLSFIDNPNTSLNESFASAKSDKNDNIHEMDTQPPNLVNENTDSIHMADTQIPENRIPSPSIHSLDTQIPVTTSDHLPLVRKIHEQQDIELDLYAANKENDTSIYNAETQPFLSSESIEKKKNDAKDRNASKSPRKNVSAKSVNTSDEELLFDEIDDDTIEDFYSQALLPQELPFENTTTEVKPDSVAKDAKQSDENAIKPSKRNTRVQSDESTDCEDDILPTQKVLELPVKEKSVQKHDIPLNGVTRTKSDLIDMMLTQKIPEIPVEKEKTQVRKTTAKPSKRVNRIVSDDSTDCEDIDMMPTQKIPEKKAHKDDDITDCEDEVDAISLNKSIKTSTVNTDVKFEDMATQIVEYKDDQAFEDMPTQVVSIIPTATVHKNNDDIHDIPTQIINEVKPNIKSEKKSFKKPAVNKTVENKSITDDDNFYAATQDIYNDLSSQREWSPEVIKKKVVTPTKPIPASKSSVDIPHRGEGRRVGESTNIDIKSPQSVTLETSISSDGEERAKRYVGNLSNEQVRQIIGVDTAISKLKRQISDSSDVEITPRKVRPIKFMDIDLPNSQEIKTSRAVHQNVTVTESSSESETEQNSEDFTPILYRKKKKPTVVAKIDLTNKFDVEKLPERVITRVRKPTQAKAEKILKPNFLTEQEDQIDQDIIIENITRLKSKYKSKDPSTDEKVVEKKSSRKEPVKSKEPKEKIKVKIERPQSKKKRSTRENNDNENSKTEHTLNSTADSRSSRSMRSRNKGNDSQNAGDKSAPSEKEKPTESKRKPANKKETVQDKLSPEVEVRRSKRQRSSKEKKDEAPKSILKRSSHEQSTVYNVSSSSDVSLKRPAMDDSDVPSPKRTRSRANSNTSIMSLRATPARLLKTQQVLFTAFPSHEVKKKLENLGAVIVNDVKKCTVVSTIKIKRTCKLLCAVGLGRPIVGPDWVQACVETRCVVDPWLYLIKDEETEKRFNFSLERTLRGKRNYLKGYNISSTPSVQPNGDEMKLIVECSGGTWQEGGPSWLCVSSSADRPLWPALKKRGATVVAVAFILDGVLRQKLDIAGNVLN